MTNTKEQSDTFFNFFYDVFGYNFGLPLDKAPKVKEGQILLFMDLDISRSDIFKAFSGMNCSAKKMGSPNIIDETITEKVSNGSLFNYEPDFRRDQSSYFFVIDKEHDSEEDFLVTPNFDIGGFIYLISKNPNPPASIEEVVLFHLFCQWSGEWSGIPNRSILTSTAVMESNNNDLEEETVAILEFDEQTLSTCIRSFEKTPREGKELITKNVLRRVV